MIFHTNFVIDSLTLHLASLSIPLAESIMFGKKSAFFSLVFLALAFYSIRGPERKIPGKVVETKSGKIQGVISISRDGREFYEWLGIPYAQPPVGKLRYASPKPAGHWEGIRDGSLYGSKCLQLDIMMLTVSGGEDCLYLNVFAPKTDHTAPLPVMVHIHGGGFAFMSPEEYRPDYFMDEDIVYVALNYRLGTFGFLSTADDVLRGNMGLKDQALALKWVKENIANFGGNPDHITIFGESAGGASVHHMMLSPMTKGLFHRAISQSGVANMPLIIEPANEGRKHTLRFASSVGCDISDSYKLSECLRGKSVEELMAASKADIESLKPHKDGHLFKPVIEAINDDQAFITEHPMDIISAGKAMRIPWMTGLVSHEGLIASLEFYRSKSSMAEFEANWDSNVLRTFGIPKTHPKGNFFAEEIRKIYFSNSSLNYETKLEQYTKLFSDALFGLHTSHAASVQSQFSPVYLYYYTRRGPSFAPLLAEVGETFPLLIEVAIAVIKQWFELNVLGRTPRDIGVAHADDLPMLFLRPSLFHIPKKEGDLDYNFSRDLVKLYADFAKNDKPAITFRGKELAAVNSMGHLKYLHIDESPETIEEPFQDRTNALKSLNFLY